jgi:menaquinone-dependent protoporphyrinogen IX oxidase
MKVLVSAASKHGATSEIAEEIAKELREALNERSGEGGEDARVEVRPPEQVNSVEDYAAVVLCSAVYSGQVNEKIFSQFVSSQSAHAPRSAERQRNHSRNDRPSCCEPPRRASFTK